MGPDRYPFSPVSPLQVSMPNSGFTPQNPVTASYGSVMATAVAMTPTAPVRCERTERDDQETGAENATRDAVPTAAVALARDRILARSHALGYGPGTQVRGGE
jgi:hypothetical protein